VKAPAGNQEIMRYMASCSVFWIPYYVAILYFIVCKTDRSIGTPLAVGFPEFEWLSHVILFLVSSIISLFATLHVLAATGYRYINKQPRHPLPLPRLETTFRIADLLGGVLARDDAATVVDTSFLAGWLSRMDLASAARSSWIVATSFAGSVLVNFRLGFFLLWGKSLGCFGKNFDASPCFG